ncbi:hypothetical protein LCGC14_0415620 [marine sediment metagenome]|uniref:Uncharacterized protein n=1 Tax=marine sediment metagenome TaxID=412755 RepID=A0A0F9VEC9_9ZZZZ
MSSAVYTRREVLSYKFEEKGTLTTSQAALGTTTLAQAVAEALTATGIMVFDVDKGTPAIELRFRGALDGDADVPLIYGIRTGDDKDRSNFGGFYRKLAVLGTVVGTGQKSSATDLFVDTVTETTGLGVEAGKANSDAANGIGSYILKLGGYDRILICASTLNSSSFSVDVARVDI